MSTDPNNTSSNHDVTPEAFEKAKAAAQAKKMAGPAIRGSVPGTEIKQAMSIDEAVKRAQERV